MKNIFRLATLSLLAAPLLLASCEKDAKDFELEGAVPQANFTFQANTTEFPTVVDFTSTSKDGFVYQWNFGDNSIGSGEKAQHTYPRPGKYEVELLTSGRGGTGISSKQTVTIPDACTISAFSNLVGCTAGGVKVWSLSNAPGAVVKQDAGGNQISSSTTLEACQLDDQFSFSNAYTLNYESAGKTYQNGACGSSRNNTGSFVFRPNNGNPQIILKGNKSFIGLADSVVNKTYDILEATDTKLRLRGTNPDGTRTIVTLMPYDATAPYKQLLTGGSSRTWMLDNQADAPITVGTEANPLEYFAGVKPGELPACQSDDEYTFSVNNTLSYNAKAETFSAGAGYVCKSPETGTSPFVFGPAAGAGLAQFILSRPGAFIGATDASPTEQVYRILEITDKKMTVRAGSGLNGGTVFTIKMVVKP
ncbi:PKD domain-containing protein [Hymenobacter cellulosilyticus]|uniref:PKD domain-containing protein n=1 Tax=Hymenobacter cellulosilyticus TaxID=2932248 RepID=A0A8T9QBD7_9BACT|nr:PKD domain-containing protein [Hymenobacter cellulosilyticus]UOQ73130.1 PKD domain-containing protein [Hymenobacter cellulosilyticus]